MLAVTFIERAVWVVAASICLLGALGVVFFRNTVHNALSLVATLFGVAVLFVAQGAYFLAAIQVIVYAGAVVVLFLFVIMLLGVDRTEQIQPERAPWRLPAMLLAAGAVGALVLVSALAATAEVTGTKSVSGRLDESNDIATLGRVLFTDYVYAFEITSVLLTIAVVGAVVLSRRSTATPLDLDDVPVREELELDEVDDADGLDVDAAEAEAEIEAVESDEVTS